MALTGIRLPKPRELPYVTPSGAAALEQCKLRTAYRADPDFRTTVPSTPAARLGSVCHRVLEEAAKGRLASSSSDFRAAFGSVWERELALEVTESRQQQLEAHWPPPQKWPNYTLRKVRTRKLAERITAAYNGAPPSRGAPAAGLVKAEHAQTAFDGQLRGRADVIRRGEETVIEDYKTGAIYEADSGEVKESYRLQLLLYAALEHAETGVWPRKAVLIPLEGEPEELRVDPEAAGTAAVAAVSALQAFNAAVRAGIGGEQLASPSPEHCRFCDYSVCCPAFWHSIDRSWAEDGVVAVKGKVASTQASRFDTIDLVLVAEAGSLKGEGQAVRIHGVAAEQFPSLLTAAAGEEVAATGLAESGAEGLARPTLRTRILSGAERCRPGAEPGGESPS